jgi:type IV pilus assembly protein PilN
MIRINLLTTERRGPKAAAAAAGGGFQAGQKMTVIGSLILILALLGAGWRFWALTQEQAEMARTLAAARREEQALASILKQVQEFEARGEQLKQRLALIDDLRKGQNAPVHIVDQISRSLPEMTWLTSMTQKGFDVTIDGRCMTLTSLSDFIGNLEATRYFKKPVEIMETAVVEGSGGDPDMIRFRIRGTFQMAGVDPPAPPTKGAAKGGKRG